MLIENDNFRVWDWMKERIPGLDRGCDKFIGYEISGNIVSGAAYERFNGVGIVAHLAIDGYVNIKFYKRIFEYPFLDLKVKKIVLTLTSKQDKQLAIVQKMGFKIESAIKNCHPDGDFLFLTMTIEECNILRKDKTKGFFNGDCS